jgi:hypothetical protein
MKEIFGEVNRLYEHDKILHVYLSSKYLPWDKKVYTTHTETERALKMEEKEVHTTQTSAMNGFWEAKNYDIFIHMFDGAVINPHAGEDYRIAQNLERRVMP